MPASDSPVRPISGCRAPIRQPLPGFHRGAYASAMLRRVNRRCFLLHATFLMAIGCVPIGPDHFDLGTCSCPSEFICNFAKPGACEAPHANGPGEACGADINCKDQLWCDRQVCRALLVEGETCAGNGCSPGLICFNDPASRTAYCSRTGGLGRPCNRDFTCDKPLVCYFVCTASGSDGGLDHASPCFDASVVDGSFPTDAGLGNTIEALCGTM
jgi:hypothetical protein